MTHKFEQEAPLTTGLYKSPDTTIHNFKSGVGVPLAQSFAVSCLFMLIVSSFRLAWLYPTEWWSWTLFVGSIIWLIQFLAGIGFWKWIIKTGEQITNIDLNRDGKIEREPAQTIRVDVMSGTKEYPRGDRIDLPYPDRLPRFSAGVLGGLAMTHRVWVSGNSRDKLFSSGEFTNLMDVLLSFGIVRQKSNSDKTRGFEPTEYGESVFEELARLLPHR